MVDRTTYDSARTPDLPLRQVFGRQRLPTDLCRLVADRRLLTVETFAMLGDNIAAVKTTLQALIPDATDLGPDGPAQELALTSLAAVWKTCSTMQDHFAARRARMEEDVLLPHHREPHRKFVERVQRDFLVHGSVKFYEVGEIRTRDESIAQKSGLSKNAEDLLKVVAIDQPSPAASEQQVMDKLHAFFVTLEYLNICDFSIAAGPLQYLSDLEEWRHENRGLALLLTVDSLIRKKVHRLSSDQRKKFTTYSSALLEVLNHHKQLWNDARSSAELDRFKQAHQAEAPKTPPMKRQRSTSPPSGTKSAKARKNKARRERAKTLLKQAKTQATSSNQPRTAARDERVPAKERSKITSFKYSGPRRCPFYNCSLGCRFGDQCKNKHLCVECGKEHSWHGNH